MNYKVVNFYAFEKAKTPLAQTQMALEKICQENNVLGTILLSPEGANFALSPDTTERTTQEQALEKVLREVKVQTDYKQFTPRYSTGTQKPFPRLKIRVQDSIITFLGEQDPSVSSIKQGGRLLPADWAKRINEGSAVIVDTRNQYEWEWGKFKDSQTFAIEKFSEFPEEFENKYKNDKDKTFLMYCTGGIRCEKAVAWAKEKGFENCYQLEGGILRFFEDLDTDSKEYYDGECFVFDRRWALDQDNEEVSRPSLANPEKLRQPKQYFEDQSAQGLNE
jgi:UPF0176 protein